MSTLQEYQRELAQILRVSPSKLPGVFAAQRPKALKIGIFYDLLALYPNADKARLRDWFSRYTSSRIYLRRIAMGTHRHDLAGVDAGGIPPEDRYRAKRRLAVLAGAAVPPDTALPIAAQAAPAAAGG
jgi:sRNA-binding protein